ncbi:NAD+ synthase [Aeromonas schubertii]|uniref:NAD+ synthase n=1 Tax=Aeromonas TaxID=642 RepID=UPI00067F4661|nr:NAD+ synthase [Aeromonas schubertii]KUE79619.1 NAD synthetase [Aeromonas schubertii]MBZ6072390.1 NAD+ synthase [Aeromonas schubertii]QCG49286.1 NAD+ synthase [Aeromonas schubertii]
MARALSLQLAQLNLTVGSIEENCDKILAAAQRADQAGADLLVCSELALTGYPPEDLLLRPDLMGRVKAALARLAGWGGKAGILVGHPWRDGEHLYNAASLFEHGKLLARYYKRELPNYGVFDEKRYFSAGEETCVVPFRGHLLGLLICEDIWQPGPALATREAGAEILVTINASPYDMHKPWLRRELFSERCAATGLPLVYLNQVCGQDELVFDGCSKVFNGAGELTQRLAAFAEQEALVSFIDGQPVPSGEVDYALPPLGEVYQALVLAVRDYVNKNGFQGAVLGLSGGIDSALTLAIAADALGKERVQAVMMPFRYTAQMSVEDAREQAERMGVEFDIVSIEPMYEAFMGQLTPMFEGTARDTTEENLQARCRGVLLMALSNKRRRIVLTTGNKSEMAVGYATLYGDMAGGFDVLKDVPKTLVFKLCEYRNSIEYVIPQRVIDRPPSAELAPDQVDQDSLPPYDILDAILLRYVEQDASVADMVAEGFDEAVVRKVIRLVDLNEYKRRQAAVGPRISARNFGKDRRYPITSGFGRQNW